jgi:hypothetical protein
MDQRLPLRGAISRGVVWSNESIQVRMGPGITAAYDLAESLDVLGIALDPNLGEPKLSVGPFHFPLKNGGRTLLRIPVQGAEVGIASHLNTDLAKILDEMQANLPENDPMLAARYRNSQQIVQGMAYMGFQHVND